MAHVFKYPEHRDVQLVKQGNAPIRIDLGQALRRGDQQGAGHWYLLQDGELHVAGSRRQVDQQ